MAKKGGVQQLQADLSTDEDFERFLERPGLLVMDIYSDWCGPCLGMVGSLKKIKLELGGDNLQLAICKSDTITQLKRFNKQSEPTWLFVTNGMAVNMMYGTNVPKLMKLIATELTMLTTKSSRKHFQITEPQPEEVERRRVKEDAIAEAIRIETAEKTKKRRDYLNFVTDTVIENLPDIGVTVFGPQVNRDMFKKIMEPADVLKIQCKDRRVVAVTRENFDVINYACKNPLDEEIIEQLEGKELLVCFWKMAEDCRQNVADVLATYAQDLTKSSTIPAEDGEGDDVVVPPILAPMKVKIEIELADGEEWEEEPEEEEIDESKSRKTTSGQPADDADGAADDAAEEEATEETEAAPEIVMPDFGVDMGDLGLDGEEEDELDKPPELVVTLPPPKRTRMKTIILPPVWVANNHRTHAALIYVFFRPQTAPFLPPDPVPEPPHIIMAFDAYKKRDLISLAQRHPDDVPLYGFFTSDEVEDAKFIANSAQSYANRTHTASDKIVFKVSKQTSHTMLSLATYGPSYVSPNTVIGKEEALKFFPVDYKTAEQEALERAELEAMEPQGRKKSKKSLGAAEATKEAAKEKARAEEEAAEEDATPTSGEDSGDSMPAEGDEAAEGGEAAPAEDGAEPTEEGAEPTDAPLDDAVAAEGETAAAAPEAPPAAEEAPAAEAAPAEAPPAAVEAPAEPAPAAEEPPA